MNTELKDNWPFKDRPLRRIVVKVGSNVLALAKGGLNRERIGVLTDALASIQKQGIEVILVSSGAVAAGRGILGLTVRPTTIPELQAVAAVGQGALMEEYSNQFRRHGLVPAQILLTRDDMDDRRRYLNIRLALLSLLSRNAIPVINENDTVTIDELKFGDNDMLSAMVAAKMEADLLVIMSNVPGLMTAHPKYHPDATVIPIIREITPDIEGLVHAEGSEFGVGGMKTKLLAARHATSFGVCCAIVNGNQDGILQQIASGDFVGTLFLSKNSRRSHNSRLHWISSRHPHGEVRIDAGAGKAVAEGHKSLLPVGIREVVGEFERGDVVKVATLEGDLLASGIVNYDASTLRKIMGKRGDEIRSILGQVDYPEAIHCDNLVVVGR